MSDILYLEEHTSCRHYVPDSACSFRYQEVEEGDELQFDNRPHNYLVFLLEGEQIVDCNEFRERRFKAGDILLIPKMARFHGRALGRLRLMICLFHTLRSVCDKFSLHSYWPLCREMDYDFSPAAMLPQMRTFADTLVYYLGQGVNCAHFHEMKQQEMMLIFRWFYTKEELASLFHPIIGNSLDFRALIMENYSAVTNVEELAVLAHMGRSRFYETFQREFGMPVGKWLTQRKAQSILHRMAEPGVTLADIIIRYDFNSPSELTRFCKQHFGQTPSEIMSGFAKEADGEAS